MMEVIAEYLGGSKFKVAARSHRVICDQPRENGGNDEGMTPPEFLLASLAACAGYYAVQYLNARKLTVPGLTVRVDAGKAQQPARLASFRIEVIAPELEERHQLGLSKAVKSCLIHNTMLGSPEIQVAVNLAPAGTEVPAGVIS